MLYWFLFLLLFFCSLQKMVMNDKVVSLINSCMVSAACMFEIANNLDIIFHPIRPVKEGSYRINYFFMAYIISDTIFWTTHTKWKYFGHHVACLLACSFVTNPAYQFMSLNTTLIFGLELGNMGYHLGSLNLLNRRKAWWCYTIATLFAFIYSIFWIIYYWQDLSVFTHLVNCIIFICIWRLKAAYKMYLKCI